MIKLVMWMLQVMVISLSLKNVKEGMSACLDRANLIFCHKDDVDDGVGSGVNASIALSSSSYAVFTVRTIRGQDIKGVMALNNPLQ